MHVSSREPPPECKKCYKQFQMRIVLLSGCQGS
uniref:Uncharacterized protein n=1 Tax=Arundo donax TaxID=35708 RepID=A0A0A9B7J4_ARUDO